MWKDEIKRARIRLGLKQLHMAQLLGTDQATISRWERGLSVPSVAVLDRCRKLVQTLHGGEAVEAVYESMLSSRMPMLMTIPRDFIVDRATPEAVEEFDLPNDISSGQRLCARTPDQEWVYGMLGETIFDDQTVSRVEVNMLVSDGEGVPTQVTTTYHPILVGTGDARVVVRPRKTAAAFSSRCVRIHRIIGEIDPFPIPA